MFTLFSQEESLAFPMEYRNKFAPIFTILSLFLLHCLFCIACSANDNRDNISHPPEPESASSERDSVDQHQRSPRNVPCGDFEQDYFKLEKLDTVIEVADGRYYLYYRAVTDSVYAIPKSLLFDCDTQSVYPVEIAVCKAEKNSNRCLKVDRSLFRRLIDQDQVLLNRYGIPIGASIKSVDSSGNSVVLNMSFSIPYTDIGEGVELTVDLHRLQISN